MFLVWDENISVINYCIRRVNINNIIHKADPDTYYHGYANCMNNVFAEKKGILITLF